MEQIGKIAQQSNIGGGLTIHKPSQPPQVPAWMKLLEIIAQDRRHDLAQAVAGLWKAKLEKYDDDDICDALKLYSGEFFPTVEAIAGLIERRHKNAATNRPWELYKRGQTEAERSGLLATEQDYAELREQFKKVASSPPLVKAIHGGKLERTHGQDSRSGVEPGIGADVAKSGEHSGKA